MSIAINHNNPGLKYVLGVNPGRITAFSTIEFGDFLRCVENRSRLWQRYGRNAVVRKRKRKRCVRGRRTLKGGWAKD